MKLSKAYNFIQIDELVSSSGTLMTIDLQNFSDESYSAVINLLPDDNEHAKQGEREYFEAQDIDYTYIPVDWEAPTSADYKAFEQAMILASGTKTHFHCAANYRATAFYGIYAFKHLGWTKEEILAFTAPIWRLSDYPVWLDFVEEQINGV